MTRSLIKLGFAVLRGRTDAHRQDAWPGLALKTADDGQRSIIYRGTQVTTLLRSAALAADGGETMHVIGSGPSILSQDLTRLPAASAILLNGAISLVPEGIVRPLAIAIEDERFIWRHFRRLEKRIPSDTLCLLSVSVIRAICEIDRTWLTQRRIMLIDNLAKPYGGPRRSAAEMAALPFVTTDGQAALSSEPDRGVAPAGSVAVSALQFALACRPQRLGLFGIDISNAAQPRFYEAAGQAAFSGIAKAEGRLLAHFALALHLAQKQDTALTCHSPISALLNCGYRYDVTFERGP